MARPLLSVHRRNSPKRSSTPVSPGVWAIVALDSDAVEQWQLLVRVVDQGGRAAIAELHVIPGAHPDATDDWVEFTTHPGAMTLLADTTRHRIPVGGINPGLLRSIGLSSLLARVSRGLHLIDEDTGGKVFDGELLGPHGLTDAALRAPGSPANRKRRSDHDLVIVAAAYLDAIHTGSRHPRKDAAQTLGRGWTPTRVRDHLHAARTRGLLTNPPEGYAGGYLTEKARTILASHPSAKTARNQRTP